MNVNFHIEELVRHGFAPGDRYRIGDAVEQELARLLGTDGLPGIAGGAWSNLSCGQIQVGRNSKPNQTGSQIAQAVHAGIASLRSAPRAIQDSGRRTA